MATKRVIVSRHSIPKNIIKYGAFDTAITSSCADISGDLNTALGDAMTKSEIYIYLSLGPHTARLIESIKPKCAKCELLGHEFIAEILKRMPARIVSLEGEIGAGKTERLGILAAGLRALGMRVHIVPEPVDEWVKIGLLQRFNQDMKRYSYELQTFSYLARSLALSSIPDDIDICLTDRCPKSCRAFGIPLEKIMSKMELKMSDVFYNAIDAMGTNHKGYIDHVYIKTDLKTCQERVAMRDRSSEAKGITLGYQQSLRASNEAVFGNDSLIIDGDVANGDIIADDFLKNELIGRTLEYLIELPPRLELTRPEAEPEARSIVIDGEIGAGKTTLINLIKKETKQPVCVIREPIELWMKLGIFDEFNADKKWSYRFQTIAVASRIMEMMNAFKREPLARYYLLERDPRSDVGIFAKMLMPYFDSMERAMLARLLELINVLPRVLLVPTRVYLKPTLKECMKRYAARGRPGELVDPAYQNALRAAHEDFYIKDNDAILLTGRVADGDFRSDRKLLEEIITKINIK